MNLTIPEKRPCPCGFKGLNGRGCPSVVLYGIGLKTGPDASMDDKTADEIIEVYKDAARMRFLLEHRELLAPLHHIKMHDQRAWIDKQMEKRK